MCRWHEWTFVHIHTSSNFRARVVKSVFPGWIGVFGRLNRAVLIQTGALINEELNLVQSGTVIIAAAHCLDVRPEKTQ
jgi:hypothetical protein